MRDRRTFLSSLGAMSLFAAASTKSDATSVSPAAKASSGTAQAIATTFRRFDSRLTTEEVATIARAIDDNHKAAATLNPKKKRLRNSDEPATVFSAGE